ncbi:hypothetical protein [Allokutzneria albata]|uniref:Uncharacterized protein n=1 Tax=Allokutzneria albata TaxID=211114 RepID=A0A1G9VMD2_ALLAB|nr:hypothetical protein [Allokutzneria albata]SDM73339.1 hypothetical protein SAMN04489726_3122 [Allokutzneria albata]
MTDPARQRRAAIREFVRANHPDVGGDPAEFVAGLARLRAGFDGPPAPAGAEEVVFVVRRRGVRGLVQRWRERRRRGPRVQ